MNILPSLSDPNLLEVGTVKIYFPHRPLSLIYLLMIHVDISLQWATERARRLEKESEALDRELSVLIAVTHFPFNTI